MKFIKGLGLGIYYRLRRMSKAFKNWRKFGVIIFGSIFLLASILTPLQAVSQALAGEQKLTYLYIDPSTLSIEQGKTYQFKYRAEDQNHQQISIMPNWSMNNSTAGNINQTGLFTASQTPNTYNNAVKLSSGALSTYARVIVAKSPAGNNGNVVVGVGVSQGNIIDIAQPAVNKLTYLYIDPSTLSIAQGKTYQFKYRAEDQNHQQISITPNWSMNNSTAGNINPTGLFTAGNMPGTYNNAVKLSSGALATYARVIVLESEGIVPPQPKLTYLYIDPSTLSIEQGKTYQFKYRAEDQNHNVMTITPNWSMNNSAAGSITQTGLFTASQTPNTYNNAVKLSSGALATYARVIVYKSVPQIQLNFVAINPTSATLYVGNQKQFSATAYDQNGAVINSGVSFRWDVTNGQAGGITQNGLFTADNHPGTYNGVIKVTATYGGVSKIATASVTVQSNPQPVIVLTSVRINPASARVHTGSQQQFTATAYDQNGTVINNRGVRFSWDVTNDLAGNINQSGLFTADYRTGNYNNLIKVIATYNGVSRSAMASVEIYEEPVVSVLNSVGINPTQVSLSEGAGYQFSATAYNQFGQVINSQVSFNWAVINGGGSINQNGWFTAGYQPGTYGNTVRVTATKSGVSKSAYATVLVNQVINQAVLDRVEIIPSSATIRINQNYDFNAQAYDNNNQAIYNDVSYSWSVISGPGSINQSGLFSASGMTGTATVQVRAMQGGRDRYALATVYIEDDTNQTDDISYVRVTPSVAYLNAGSAIDFDAQAYDYAGRTVSAAYTWDLMSNIGTLNQNGYFVAGSNIGTFNDAIRVRAYRNGIERNDYADVVISSSQINYNLNATLTATDDNGGTTYENDTLTYTLQLTNNRSDALTNVSASFEVPTYTTFMSVTSIEGSPSISGRLVQWNAGTLYVNNTKTLIIKVRVNSQVPSNTIIRGKASVWASEINTFGVYANDIYVAGTSQPVYNNGQGGVPLIPTGAAEWIVAGAASLLATILSKKFWLRSLL